MKWLRTLVLFDQGNILQSDGWAEVHNSYRTAIESIHFPPGSGKFTIRAKALRPGSKQFNRNGVGYLRSGFLQNMVDEQGWSAEAEVDFGRDRVQPAFKLYPSCEEYREPITSGFGGFDFLTTTSDGIKVAIEWETGNISSSHRSMNKLAIALKTGNIDAGVLILPSKKLYVHLTDRIGNISELSGYLEMWESLKVTVERGLLAVTVVEYDDVSNTDELPYLPAGNDGRSKAAKARG